MGRLSDARESRAISIGFRLRTLLNVVSMLHAGSMVHFAETLKEIDIEAISFPGRVEALFRELSMSIADDIIEPDIVT